MGIDAWKNVRGRFTTRRALLRDAGPLKASFVLVGEYEGSRLTQEFTLHPQDDCVRVNARLLWTHAQHMCKLAFPAGVASPVGVYETPYAVLRRSADAGEVPANRWAAIVGVDGRGVAVANDGRHGFDIDGGALRMTAVRSPTYGSMVGNEDAVAAGRPAMDLGEHTFDYVMTRPENVAQAADLLNMPVQITPGFPHAGSLPPMQSILSVTPAAVQLVAAKRAEDGDGWIIRLWERTGGTQKAGVDVLGKRAADVTIGPWQLKTLRVRRDGARWSATETGLTER